MLRCSGYTRGCVAFQIAKVCGRIRNGESQKPQKETRTQLYLYVRLMDEPKDPAESVLGGGGASTWSMLAGLCASLPLRHHAMRSIAASRWLSEISPAQ